MKFKTLLFSTLLALNIFSLKAQNAKDFISVSDLNSKYLEHLIKIKIDSVRENLSLSTLVNDSILYVAANYHAAWLEENNAFTHIEKDVINFETPQDRANSFGAKNYLVGENIIKSYINTPLKSKKNNRKYINKTYDDLANDFVEGWVNSPGHYANIITPNFNVTGLSIAINKKRKLVYAVQKFAEILYKYEFEENKKMFSFSNYIPPKKITSFENTSFEIKAKQYRWKIKAPKDSIKLCKTCNTAIDNREFKEYIKFKGLNLYFKTANIKMLAEILKGRKSGLAIEEVQYSAYDCGNPQYYTAESRRNQKSILNGKVYEPVYKKEIKDKIITLKNTKSNSYFNKRLARISKEQNGYVEYNILVLKKNQICRVMHYSGYCGEAYHPTFNPEINERLALYNFEMPLLIDTLNFEIPFEKNKYEYDLEEIKPLLGSFKDTRFIIKEAQIQTFSSLEGNKEINLKLQQKRAESILNIFEENQNEKIIADITSEENWKTFESQIKNNPELKVLKDLSRIEIIEKLKDENFIKEIEPFLKEQRKAFVSLIVEYKPNPDSVSIDILNKISTYFQSKKSKKQKKTFFSIETTDSIYTYMYSLYSLIKYEKGSDASLNKLKNIIDTKSNFAEYLIDIDCDLGNYDSILNSEKYLSDNKAILEPAFHTAFNRLNISINNLLNNTLPKKSKPESIYEMFEYIKKFDEPKYKFKIDSLELNYLIGILNYLGNDFGTKEIQTKVNKFAELLVNKALSMNLSDKKLLVIAKHLLNFENDKYAFLLLNNMVLASTELEEVYILHAKMSYYHNKEYNNNFYHNYLISLYNKLEQKSWCDMFVGPCNISFQVFDYEKLRNFYCENCSEYKNYGQNPSLWNKK